MNFSITQLKAVVNKLGSNPNSASLLSKLTTVDILKSLGSQKYTVLFEGKTLTAQSDKTLHSGDRYWTQLSHNKDTTLQLSKLVKMPQMLQSFKTSQIEYSLKDLQTILNSKTPTSNLKQSLLENLSHASTKEEFSNISTLLLSLQNNVFTIPLSFHNYFSILQFKKRYNKKTKTTQINFYAALESLGPVSGLISIDETNTVDVVLHVAYTTTKTFLEDDMKNFSHTLTITLHENIEPLYSTSHNSLLDISI